MDRVWIVLAALLMLPGAALATHYPPDLDSGGAPVFKCGHCHAVSGAIPGTHLIKRSQFTEEIGFSGGEDVPCVFCHRQDPAWNPERTRMRPVREHFTATSLSHHEVDESTNSQGGSTIALDCVDCHTGLVSNGVAGDGAGNANVHGKDAAAETLDVYTESLIETPTGGTPGALQATCLSLACHGDTASHTYGNVTAQPAHWTETAAEAAALGITLNDQDSQTVNGAGASWYCGDCHGSHRSVDGVALLTVVNTSGANGQAATNQTVQPGECEVCHDADDGGTFTTQGHGQPAINGGSVVCTACHTGAVAHSFSADGNPANPLRFLFAQPDSLTSAIRQAPPYENAYSICLTCHNVYQGRAHGLNVYAGCNDCHEPHGKGLSGNIKMVRSLVPKVDASGAPVYGDGGGTAYDPVVYQSSLDTYRADGQGLCDNAECHQGRVVNGDAIYPLGAGTTPLMADSHHTGGNQTPADDCLTCHKHGDAGGVWSASESCTTCHGQPPVSTATTSEGYATFNETRTPHAKHAAAYAYACQRCHANYADSAWHNTGGWNDTTGTWQNSGDASYQSVYFDAFNPDVDNTPAGTAPQDHATSYDATNRACATLYCHSDGQVYGAGGSVNSGPVPWNDSDWNLNDLGCEACHGGEVVNAVGTKSYGAPDHPNEYPDLAGGDTPNSHDRHANYACSVCHNGTITDADETDGWTLAGVANHVNGVKDLQADGVTGSFTTGGATTCTAVSCHGGGDANWGATLTCADCHLSTADVNDYTFGNAVTASVKNAGEWDTTGHGRPSASGNYRSNNPAGDVPNCTTHCHTDTVLHGDPNNPFRLITKGASPITDFSDGADPQADNTVCLDCHGTTGQSSGSATMHVDENHFGAKHTGNEAAGGSFCWDCHDPHGDTRDYMVHSGSGTAPGQSVTVASDGQFGIPVVGAEQVTGLDVSTGGYTSADLANSATTGFCQVCHTATNFYNQTLFTPLNSHMGADGTRCTACHSHKDDFAPSCTSCHGDDVAKTLWPDGNPANNPGLVAYADDEVGSHAEHIALLQAKEGFTLDLADQIQMCAYCHPSPGGANHDANTTGSPANQADLLGDGFASGTYKRIDGVSDRIGADDVHTAGTYDPVAKTCAGVDCHYETPTPAYAGLGWDAGNDGTPENAANCETCHFYRDGATYPTAENWNSTAPQLPDAHQAHTGGIPPPNNAHGKSYPCSYCHADAGYTTAHLNGSIDLDVSATPHAGGDESAVPTSTAVKYGAGTADTTCSGVYCHGADFDTTTQGIDVTPVWSLQTTGTCGDCHDINTESGAFKEPLTQGAHEVHMAQASGILYGPGLGSHANRCQVCHGWRDTGGVGGCNTNCHQSHGSLMPGAPGDAGYVWEPSRSHVEGAFALDFEGQDRGWNDVFSGPGYTGPGTLDTLGTAPDFPDGTDICSRCHGTALVGGLTGAVQAKQNWDTGTRLDCEKCHTAPSGAVSTPVDGGVPAPAKTAYAGHGGVAPSQSCQACHDESGAHISTAAGDQDRIVQTAMTTFCQYCHDNNGIDDAVATAAEHVVEVAATMVSTHGNTSASYTPPIPPTEPDGGTFSQACLDCHDPHGTANLSMVSATINGQPVTFTDRTQFDTAAGTTDVCEVCHTATEHNGGIGGEHSQSYQGTSQCTGCHSHEYDANPATADGFMPLRCDACHAYPPVSGAHPRHATDYGYSCFACHNGNNHNELGVSDAAGFAALEPVVLSNAIDIGFDATNPSGAYAPAKGSRTSAGAGTCSVLYCHGDHDEVDIPAGIFPSAMQGTDTTPEWNVPATATCGTCHLDTTATWNGRGTYWHQKHAGTAAAGGYDMGCDICHYSVTTDGATITNPANHVNREANVAFSATDPRLNTNPALPPVSTYNGDTVVGSGYGSCDNTFCHSQANDLVPPFTYPPNTPLSWDATSTPSCGCHASAIAGGPWYDDGLLIDGVPKANKHPKHRLNGTGCTSCHGWWGTATTTYHVNGQYDPTGGSNNTLDDFTFTRGITAGGINGTCSAVACHGGTTVDWADAGPLSCDVCHGQSGGSPATADVKDFAFTPQAAGTVMSKVNPTEYTGSGHGMTAPRAIGKACGDCHDSTTTHDTTMAGANPFRLLDQDGVTAGVQYSCAYAGTGCHVAGTLGPRTGVDISTFTTHSNEAIVASAITPKRTWPAWDPECVNCHDPHGDGNLSMVSRAVYDKAAFALPGGAPPAFPTEQTNLVFTDDATGASATNDSFAYLASPYSGACQECHEAADHASFKDDTTPVIDAGHPGSDAAPPGDCSACHPHDKGFGASCTGCHGGGLIAEGNDNWWPDSQALHGTSWPNRDGGATPHTRHVTRIAAVVNGTATPTTAQKNGTCSWCHPTGGHTGDATDHANPPATLMDGTTYVFKNIAGADNLRATTVTQGPGLDGVWGDPLVSDDEVTCANVDCHYTRTMGAGDWYSPSPQSTCAYCHVADNLTYVAGDLPNAHDKHVGDYNQICALCHPIWGGTFNHQDGVVNLEWTIPGPEAGDRLPVNGPLGPVKFGGGTAADYPTCTGLICHGDWDDPGIAFKGGNNASANWFNTDAAVNPGIPGDGDGACGTCHGDVAGTSDTEKAYPRTGTMAESHAEHVASNAAPTCSACHYDAAGTNGTYPDPAAHANRVFNGVVFDTASSYEAATASFDGALHTCADVRCHNGVTTPAFTLTDGGVGDNIACGDCHNTGGSGPLPSDASVAGSHARHANNDGDYSECDACHGDAAWGVTGQRSDQADPYTATGGGNGLHQNLVVDLYINGSDNAALDRYDDETLPSATAGRGGVNYLDLSASGGEPVPTDNGTCSSTACHGSGQPAWGGTLANGCFDCHGGAEVGATKPAVDTTPNPVDPTEYNTQGHGQTGAFPGSGNTGPGYTYGSTPGCYTCHDSAAVHAPVASATDPFRLGPTYATDTDGLCATCHGAGGTATVIDIVSHTQAVTGSTKTWPGNYDWKCVDCHDPHGDGNYYMVRSHISAPLTSADSTIGSDAYGTPQDTANATGVAFTDLSGVAAGSYGVTGGDGMCEVCHNQTNYFRRGDASDETHNAGSRCTSCHQHGAGFKASCSGCHGGGTVVGSNANYWPDEATGRAADRDFATSNGDDVGAHFEHVRGLARKVYNEDITALLTDNANGTADAKQKALCAYCHPDPAPGNDADHATNDAAEVPGFRFLDGSADDGGSDLKGSVSDTAAGAWGGATCTNADCHYEATTTNWYAAPLTGDAMCTLCHEGISTHVAGGCTNCHPGGAGTNSEKHTAQAGGTASVVLVPSPSPSWDDPGTTATESLDMRSRLGVLYLAFTEPKTVQGTPATPYPGIHLGGDGTSGNTEADICWSCHGSAAETADPDTAADVTEWGYNYDPDGSTWPKWVIQDEAGASRPRYNYGWLYSSNTFGTRTNDWTNGDQGGAFRKDGYQHDPAILSKQITSIHSANVDDQTDTGNRRWVSSVAATVNSATGAVTRGTAANLEHKAEIRCSYCHDVHDTFGPSGRPYVRGTWAPNPYPEDMPPQAGYVYPTRGGPDAAANAGNGAGNRFQSRNRTSGTSEIMSVGLPRLYAYTYTAAEIGAGEDLKGGFWIDKNSGNPPGSSPYSSYGSFGGLCALCHTMGVDGMNYYLNGANELWQGAANGHVNSVQGGSGMGGNNLFDARRTGTSGNFMAEQDGIRYVNWGKQNNFDANIGPWGNIWSGPQPCGGQMGSNCPPLTTGWYSTNIADQTRPAGDYSTWYGTGTVSNAHKFPCAKCHSPHATGLPVLLITNCLDKGLASWSANSNRVGPNANTALRQNPPNNCHRKTSNTDGWNILAPGQ